MFIHLYYLFTDIYPFNIYIYIHSFNFIALLVWHFLQVQSSGSSKIFAQSLKSNSKNKSRVIDIKQIRSYRHKNNYPRI